MKNFAKFSIIIGLIFSILSCSVFSPQKNEPSEITLTDEKPVMILDTGNSDYPRIALFKGGEVIVPFAETDTNGQVTGISGAVFIAPDGSAITFYFENGLPVRAIAEDHLIQFENFTGSMVDITVIAPDGTISKQEQVPFDTNQITPIGSQSGMHLASMAKTPSNNDINNWLSNVSTAVGIFSCAATAATAGTLAVTFGVGCGLFVYETYLKIVEKDPPIAVKGTGMLVSGIGCATGVTKKDPLGLVECVSLVLDVVEIAVKKSQETEQKLVTLVGANPNRKSELSIETIVEPVLTTTSSNNFGCDNPDFTVEEKFNCNSTTYVQVSCELSYQGESETDLCSEEAYNFDALTPHIVLVDYLNQGKAKKSDKNSYCIKPRNPSETDCAFIIDYTNTGFVMRWYDVSGGLVGTYIYEVH